MRPRPNNLGLTAGPITRTTGQRPITAELSVNRGAFG